MQVRVECYAGHRADQRPLRFFLNQQSYVVEEVVDQWYEPHGIYFKVRAQDGNYYILRHEEDPNHDAWSLVSFRRVLPAV